MKIGIKFKVPNEWGNVIYNILCGINFEKYIWKISEDEVYIKDDVKNNGFLFPQEKDVFCSKEFMEIISYFSYYTVSLNLQAYFKENDFREIKNYNDFKNSKCEFVVFVTDNIFVNIYAKSERIIEKIKENATLNKYEHIEYIIEEVDK